MNPLDDLGDASEPVPINECDTCIKSAMIDLSSNDVESDIREKIVQLCKEKLPFMQPIDFDFIKRTSNRLCKPTVGKDFKYDYPQIKKLAGQEKIYIRLKTNFSQANNERQSNTESSDEEDLPSFLCSSQSDLPSSSKTTTLSTISNENKVSGYCLLYTSPSPRDKRQSRMPSSA